MSTLPRIRHQTAPAALGCRWCGVGQRGHGQRWLPGRGFHVWVEPTRDQVEARMRARFAKPRKTVTTTTTNDNEEQR